MRRSILVAACALALAAPAVAQETNGSAADVAVTVTYKGAGAVDAKHKIWVFLFDSPNVTSGALPIASIALEKNGGTATFKAVKADPVYITVAFDEGGNYDGETGPPPAGTPIAAYRAKDATSPSPVKPGDTIMITFDDRFRMR